MLTSTFFFKPFALAAYLSLQLLAGPLLAGDPTAYTSSSTQDLITAYNPATGRTSRLANGGLDQEGIGEVTFVVNSDATAAYVLGPAPYPVGAQAGVVDLTTGKLTQQIAVGEASSNLALSPDGSLLYLIIGESLTALNTKTLAVFAQASYGECPCQIVLSPDGSHLYLGGAFGLLVYDSPSLTQVAAPNLGYTLGMSLSPDGSNLYALTPDENVLISVIDTASNTVVAAIPNQAGEGSVTGTAVSPDGATLYLAGSKGLLRFATATNTFIDQTKTSSLSGQLAVSPDGKYVYVNRINALYREDSITSTVPGLLVFDTAAATFSNIPIGGPAIAEQIPSSGSPVYVLQGTYGITAEDPVSGTVTKAIPATGSFSLTVSSSGNMVAGVTQVSLSGVTSAEINLVSTATHTIVGEFSDPLPAAGLSIPYAYPIALNANGTAAYLAYPTASNRQGFNETVVSVLELPAGTVQQNFSVYPAYGQDPSFLAVSPDGSRLFVLLSSPGGIGPVGVCSASLSTFTQIACLNLTVPGTTQDSTPALAVSADGTSLYVPVSASLGSGYPSGNYLVEVDAASMTAIKILTLDNAGSKFDFTSGIAYSASTNSVYVAIQSYGSTGELARVDLDTYTIANTQGVNYLPAGLAITPDGTRLLVTGSPHGTQIFDGATLAPIGSIAGGQQQAIVIAPQ